MRNAIVICIGILLPLAGKSLTLTGKIVDTLLGPVYQTSVKIQGAYVGTVTARDGTFALDMMPGPHNLVLVHQYYPTYIVPFTVTRDTFLEITLPRYASVFSSYADIIQGSPWINHIAPSICFSQRDTCTIWYYNVSERRGCQFVVIPADTTIHKVVGSFIPYIFKHDWDRKPEPVLWMKFHENSIEFFARNRLCGGPNNAVLISRNIEQFYQVVLSD